MLRAALKLAEKGMRVFPCMPRDKVPATPNGCKDATAGPELIKQWWERNPEFNVGLATGAPSGVFVIDIDGLDAEAELRKLEAEHGALPPTVEAVTARGRHAYFSAPDVPVRNSPIGPGIDTRGDGGYVLAPPSIHPTGKKYRWSVDSASAFAAAPQWLIDKVATPVNGAGAAAPPSVWRALARDGAGEGGRNTAITKLAGYLLRRYIDPVVALELLHAWNETRCAPPLPEADITRICDSISKKELNRRGA